MYQETAIIFCGQRYNNFYKETTGEPYESLYVSRRSLRTPCARLLLRLDHNTLELFEDWELLISRVDFGVTLLFTEQKSHLFETLQFSLDIAWIFFDQLGKPTNVRVKVRILGVYHDNFSAHS